MSRSRKHVTLGLDGVVQPPEPGQSIVRALGSRGSNLIEVEFPDGRQTLVLMPAKFNKKLWVKRGGFLLVEDSAAAEGDAKVTGTILAVLYEEQIRQYLKMPGVWPKEFAVKEDRGSLNDMMPPSESESEGEQQGETAADGDYGPPIPQNLNRKVIYHEVSSDDDSTDGD